MKIKTSELIGNPLAWAVAVANGNESFFWANWDGEEFPETDDGPYRPDLEWSQGGPIIERELIRVISPTAKGINWVARIRCGMTGTVHEWLESYGPTPLIAAMRVFVASKLSDEVEIPEELV